MSAVASQNARVEKLCVRKVPHSGKPQELLAYEEIDKDSIVKKVTQLVSS